MNTQEQFPNGFDSWQRTHFEIASRMSYYLDNMHQSSKVLEIFSKEGALGVYNYAKTLTDEFEKRYQINSSEIAVFYDSVDDFYDNINRFIVEKTI